ncbi:nuclear transport factor 2 family protein [Microbacterium lacus]|uniref:nuclear transport factor 2 family protein n=1 Tax=Microbacterium lacus TaxID=415217 RepID=UPI00385113F7
MTPASRSTNTRDPEFQRLVDVSAIKELHIRYCRGLDRMDWDLIRSIYHPDAIDNHRKFRGGVEEFVHWCAEVLPRFACTTHVCANQFVEVHGDSGWMESTTLAYHRTYPTDDEPAADYMIILRYIDIVERRNGEWRILDRTIVHDTETIIPVGGEHARIAPVWLASTRDPTDASYAAALVAEQRAHGGDQRLSV